MVALVERLVEVEFTAGVWTDVTSYLESEVSVTFGRGDEFSQADANQCTLVLDNTDGRFTPGRASGAYYPNVKVGRGIRVSVTVDGVTSRRFTGLVDSWRVQWDGTDSAATVEVQASSQLARLGLTTERRSVIEEEGRLDSPIFYYTLGEPTDSTAASDSSDQQHSPLVRSGAGVTFGTGTGPGVDALPAVQLAVGSDRLVASPADDFDMSAAGGTVMVAFAIAAGNTNPLVTLFRMTDTPSPTKQSQSDFVIQVESADVKAGAAAGTSGRVVHPASLMDGNIHHLAVTTNATGSIVSLYVDGVFAATGVGLTAGRQRSYVIVGPNTADAGTQKVSVAHLSGYATQLSAARIAEHAQAVADGFAGEDLADRLDRYAAWVGTTASTTVTGIPVGLRDPSGAQVVELIRELEATSGGVLYDSRDGDLTLIRRDLRYTEAPTVELDVAAQQVQSDYVPTTDRQGLVNDVTASAKDGTAAARVVDTVSVAAYGVASESLESVAVDTTHLRPWAEWTVHAHAEPQQRVPTLSVDVLNANLDVADLLGLTVGSRVTVTNPPVQAAGDGDYFVEGYTETFGAFDYGISLNVSPAAKWAETLVLDDAARGLLDTNTLAY